jgi:hypothetical protein
LKRSLRAAICGGGFFIVAGATLFFRARTFCLFVPREALFQNLDIRLVLYDEPVWPSLDALSKKEVVQGREGG